MPTHPVLDILADKCIDDIKSSHSSSVMALKTYLISTSDSRHRHKVSGVMFASTNV